MLLPVKLKKWYDLLTLFPEDIAKELGDMVLRLSVAIGPLKHSTLSGIEEPDGFNGLSSKGKVEHLIPSEWLLADEIPVEFDRRAAMGEHLYYNPERVEFRKGPVSVILFDSGPMQLGTPKIIHLALLILFARRAENVSADFYWGVIQKSRLEKGFSKHSVSEILKSGQLKEVSPLMIKDIKKEIESLGDVSDLYVVGDREFQSTLNPKGIISLNENISEEKTGVEISKKGKGSKSVELILPKEDILVRILRNPFGDDIRPSERENSFIKHRIIPLKPPVFSRNKRKIAVTVEDAESSKNGVMLLSIPNSAIGQEKGQCGRPKYIFSDHKKEIAGVTVNQKKMSVILFDKSSVYFKNFYCDFSISKNETDFTPPCKDDPLFKTICFEGYSTGNDGIYFIDGKKDLYKIQEEKAIKIKSSVFCLHNTEYELLIAEKKGKTIVFSTIPGTKTFSVPIKDSDCGKTFVSDYGMEMLSYDIKENIGLFAVNINKNLWSVYLHGYPELLVNCPEGGEVVGVGMFFFDYINEDGDFVPYLIIVDKNRKTVSIINNKNYYDVLSSPDPIDRISVDTAYGNTAFITKTGSLVVYSISRKEYLIKITGGRI